MTIAINLWINYCSAICVCEQIVRHCRSRAPHRISGDPHTYNGGHNLCFHGVRFMTGKLNTNTDTHNFQCWWKLCLMQARKKTTLLTAGEGCHVSSSHTQWRQLTDFFIFLFVFLPCTNPSSGYHHLNMICFSILLRCCYLNRRIYCSDSGSGSSAVVVAAEA